jgi:oligopeptide/dipeptide ABC transporter ATP-binding protein
MTDPAGSSTGPLLQVTDLRVTLPSRRGDLTAVESVDFTVNASEIVGIAGESGSGKTLSVLAMLGLLPGSGSATGRAFFQGRDLLAMERKQLQSVRGGDIGIVFQDPMNSLHPMLTIGRQLTEHQRVHRQISKKAALARAAELLDTVRIPNPAAALERHPHNFSGGMRQRIAIAMALACEPKLLIADEPTTALDVTVQAGILRLIDRLRREQQLAVIMITHDLGVLSAVADRLYVFYSGRVVESGRTGEVLSRPRHPYTRGLLDALPEGDDPSRPLTPIPGAPPVLGAREPGCAFHPRCDFAVDDCRVRVPPLVQVAPDRLLACPPDPIRADEPDPVP